MIRKFILALAFGAFLKPGRIVAANEAPSDAPDHKAMLCEILELDPKTATEEQIRDAYEALGETSPAEETAANERIANFKAACVALGLPETSDGKALHAAILAVPGKITAANEAKTLREKYGKALFDRALTEGRVLEADRPGYVVAFNDNFSAAETKLAGEVKKINTGTGQIDGLGDRKHQLAANESQRREKIHELVHARMTAFNESYEVAYPKIENDPKHAALFPKD